MRSGPGFASEYQSRPQGSGWADSFQPQTQSKGKGRAQEPVHLPNGYAGEEYGAGSGGYSHSGMVMGGMGMGMGMGMGGYQPSFQPMYSGYHNSQYQPPPQQQLPQSALSTEKSMEDAFEAAMSDWKAMGDEHKQQELSKEEVKVDEKQDQAEEVEDRGEAKGELEKVWESLTSDETRQDKLAQWEKDFSQVSRKGPSELCTLRTGSDDSLRTTTSKMKSFCAHLMRVLRTLMSDKPGWTSRCEWKRALCGKNHRLSRP